MDPNATLAKLRDLVAGVLDGRVDLLDADEVVELVEALDGWLSGGGCLPVAWARR